MAVENRVVVIKPDLSTLNLLAAPTFKSSSVEVEADAVSVTSRVIPEVAPVVFQVPVMSTRGCVSEP